MASFNTFLQSGRAPVPEETLAFGPAARSFVVVLSFKIWTFFWVILFFVATLAFDTAARSFVVVWPFPNRTLFCVILFFVTTLVFDPMATFDTAEPHVVRPFGADSSRFGVGFSGFAVVAVATV